MIGRWVSGSSGDSTQLLYLRARHYTPSTGRFLTRDTWMGDYNRPLSLNRWIYGYGNPVNLTDPTGHFPAECLEADNFAQCLHDCDQPTTTITSIPINCDEIAGPLGRDACRTYLAMREYPGWWSRGWWNGWRDDALSPQAFLGFLASMEFNGQNNNGFDKIEDYIQAETIARNFYYRCPYIGCRGGGDLQSPHDIFTYIGFRKMLSIRLGVQALPEKVDSEIIEARWAASEAVKETYSHVDFERWFLSPDGAWKSGAGQPVEMEGLGWVDTVPLEWGNLTMFQGGGRYQQAWRLTNDPSRNVEDLDGLAENRFFRVRGRGDSAVIVTNMQCRYWKNIEYC